jgi:hypothetical protein
MNTAVVHSIDGVPLCALLLSVELGGWSGTGVLYVLLFHIYILILWYFISYIIYYCKFELYTDVLVFITDYDRHIGRNASGLWPINVFKSSWLLLKLYTELVS